MPSKQRATMSRWLVTGLLCLTAVTACGDERDDANTLTLTVGGFGNDSAVTRARVTFPGFDKEFVDYGRSGPLNIPVSARSGIIRMQFARIKGQSDTIGKADLSLEITRGYVYGAIFVRQPAGIPFICFGCNGVQKSPMMGSASASTDSMHLHYSRGLPLCRGCVAQRRDSVIVVARKD